MWHYQTCDIISNEANISCSKIFLLLDSTFKAGRRRSDEEGRVWGWGGWRWWDCHSAHLQRPQHVPHSSQSSSQPLSSRQGPGAPASTFLTESSPSGPEEGDGGGGVETDGKSEPVIPTDQYYIELCFTASTGIKNYCISSDNETLIVLWQKIAPNKPEQQTNSQRSAGYQVWLHWTWWWF